MIPSSGTDFSCDVAIPDPSALEVVHEDARVLAFHHTRPFWETHIVAVPKRHIPSLTDTGDGTQEDLLALLIAVQGIAREIEAQQGRASVTTNLGAYQDSKHLHVHIHSGNRRSG